MKKIFNFSQFKTNEQYEPVNDIIKVLNEYLNEEDFTEFITDQVFKKYGETLEGGGCHYENGIVTWSYDGINPENDLHLSWKLKLTDTPPQKRTIDVNGALLKKIILKYFRSLMDDIAGDLEIDLFGYEIKKSALTLDAMEGEFIIYVDLFSHNTESTKDLRDFNFFENH